MGTHHSIFKVKPEDYDALPFKEKRGNNHKWKECDVHSTDGNTHRVIWHPDD